MKNTFITGIIPGEEKDIIFSSLENSFEFCFMTDSIYSTHKKNIAVNVDVNDGFIFGKTHDNHDIAIYLGDRTFEVLGTFPLNTSTYIKSLGIIESVDLTEYEGIKFVGGTLNNVFNANALDIKYEEGKTFIEYKDDTIQYRVITEDYDMTIDVSSSISEHRGIEGKTISNTDVALTMKFNKPQKLRTLFKHYNKIRDVLSFMTFRNNVDFDKIYLEKKDNDTNILMNFAEVYIRKENKLTKKKFFSNISFLDLGKSFENLLKIIYEGKDNSKSISLGFIPLNDEDFYVMTNEKVKNICTALECEFSFIPEVVENEKNETMDNLIKTAEKVVKEFRKGHKELSDDVYSLIFSDIKRWSFPAKEKFCTLCHKYEQEMLLLNNSTITVTDKMIEETVKFRNDITHGNHRVLNSRIALTAHYLSGLIYCCILERIGLDREKIIELCKEKILS